MLFVRFAYAPPGRIARLLERVGILWPLLVRRGLSHCTFLLRNASFKHGFPYLDAAGSIGPARTIAREQRQAVQEMNSEVRSAPEGDFAWDLRDKEDCVASSMHWMRMSRWSTHTQSSALAA